MKNQLHIIIVGQVQGVGFRFSARERAQELSLTGWIKNLSDNKVEILVQGKKAELNLYLKWAEKGPSFAQVLNMEHDWQEADNVFNRFEIII